MLICTNLRRTGIGATVKRPSNGAGSPRSVALDDSECEQVAPQGGGPIYLFKDWKRVAELIRSAKSIVLFLDFDGTLAPLRTDRKSVV